VTIASHAGRLTELATVLLPSTSWAEQVGDVRQREGRRQVSEKAIEPQAPASRVAAGVRRGLALGYEAQWTKLKQIRVQLIGSVVEAPLLASLGSTRVRSRP